MAKRNLIVSRVFSTRGILTAHVVTVDGKVVGEVKSGQTLSFPISEGKHTVAFKSRPAMKSLTFGPYEINVGKSDIRATIDPRNTAWRCDITGTADDVDLEGDMADAFAELLREMMNELQRKPKSVVFFYEKGAQIGLQGFTYSYGSLTGSKVRTLQLFEQSDAAKAFGWYIHESGNDRYADVFVSGRSVELTRK